MVPEGTRPLTLSLMLQTHSGYFSSLYPHHQFGPFPHHHSVSAPQFSRICHFSFSWGWAHMALDDQ